MKYEIKIPALLGDVIPLYFVADAMAGAASTAFGKTPPHKPTYDCDLRTHIKHLLDQAHSGKLVVCNRAGNIGTTANIIAAAKKTGNYFEKSRFVREPDWAELKRLHPPAKEGVLDLSGVDLGPSITDWDVTNIECLYSKLHCLNEWGKPRGDEFSIAAESAAWVDERGHMEPEAAVATEKVEARLPVATQQNNAILNWLKSNNHDPLKLPVPPSGKAGVKKLCRDALHGNCNQLFSSKSVFDTTWERLRANSEIKDAQ